MYLSFASYRPARSRPNSSRKPSHATACLLPRSNAPLSNPFKAWSVSERPSPVNSASSASNHPTSPTCNIFSISRGPFPPSFTNHNTLNVQTPSLPLNSYISYCSSPTPPILTAHGSGGSTSANYISPHLPFPQLPFLQFNLHQAPVQHPTSSPLLPSTRPLLYWLHSFGIPHREHNRRAKLKQLQNNIPISTELSLRYWHAHNNIHRFATIQQVASN